MTKPWVHAFRLNKWRKNLQRKKQLPAFSRKICTHGLGVIMNWRIAWVICWGLKTGKVITSILRYMWKNLFLRYFNRFHQIHPIFLCWLTMLAAKASFSANKTIIRTFEIYLHPYPRKLQTLILSMSTCYICKVQRQKFIWNMRKSRWMWEQRLTHLKSYGHIQKHSQM